MASLGKTSFKGRSGRQYCFRVFPWGTRFRKVSGVYVVAHRDRSASGGLQYIVLFVGQTADFSRPFDQHHKAQELSKNGANCICVFSDGSEESRADKERDLIDALKPECNE